MLVRSPSRAVSRLPVRGPIEAGGLPADLAVFADGTEGFLFDSSKMVFQNILGQTPASSAGENIGLVLDGHAWGGRALTQLIAAQPELVTNGDFATGDLTGWASFDTGTGASTYENGGMRLVGTSSTNRAHRSQLLNLTPGKQYRMAWDAVGTDVVRGIGPGPNTGATVAPNALPMTGDNLMFAAAAANYAMFRTGSGGGNLLVDNISIKEVPGNHGSQTTTSFQPRWQTGGFARFDGLDDNLLTPLNPAASFSMLFKGKITSASKVVMGSRAAVDTRALIGTDANGLFAGGVGADGTTTIKGGPDIRGTMGVGALVYSAAGVKLYWNGAEVYAGPLNGAPNTTIPLLLGAFNDNGTAGSFADTDNRYALAIKKAITPSQIAAITNYWGTT